jgi:hypothetical protein
LKRKQLMNSLTPDHGVRGTAHEYWIERRRARLQARKAASLGRVGPQARKHCQGKKENKILDPWA